LKATFLLERGFFFALTLSLEVSGATMKLVTYIDSRNEAKYKEKVGLVAGLPAGNTDLAQGRLIDAIEALNWLPRKPATAPTDMLTVIQNADEILPAFRQVLEAAESGKLPSTLSQPLAKARLVSPIPRPVSMRDGYAFRQHVEAARRNRGVPMIPEFDHFPIFYFTNHLAVTGPGEVPVQKKAQEKLDFELEVAVVVGKPGKNISAAEADKHIFGYMVMNDWSARTLQMEEMKLNLGPAKGKDFATSLGPFLVTRDELDSFAQKGPNGERHDLRMRAYVNGKQLSDGNLKDMSWTFAQILERVSYGVQVHPGEVIGSGTVGTGCLLELNGSKITDNLWLKPGDEVVMEVDGLGRLENIIEDAGA